MVGWFLVLLVFAPLPGSAIDTVPALNISRYIGRWYQVYNDLAVASTFERNGVCITADYGLLPNGSVSVFNAERLKTPDGDPSNISGYAYQNDPDEPGKLTVQLQGVPTPGPYWVVQLGPATYEGGLYQYAVVSDFLLYTLFVLTRNVNEFKENYDAQVLAKLKEQGFTKFFDKPIEVYQGEDCIYPPID